jgi:hypothetical protein
MHVDLLTDEKFTIMPSSTVECHGPRMGEKVWWF